MSRTATRRIILLLTASASLAPAAGFTRPAPASDQTIEGRTFTLLDGFTIDRVAGPPLVDRPITADFDERGRLYVADSSGSNDKVDVQLAQKPHRIVRLEDSDGDGRFDRRTVFADKMMFPEGTLWYDGSLYVAAPPSIWKLTDTDDDGVADRRVEWFRGKTLTGCATDLHGPYLGPDGWIYWCKGAFASQTYERPGKPPFVSRASHIFRARPDGSGIEPVMTGGMDNPVDVVFTPGGERIFSCTFLQNPGGGRRDGLIHAVYGGVYGKVHDVLDGHLRTGPDVMPVLSHLGPAAPCGLTAYESGVFGKEFRDNLFACNFNLQKVSRHVLSPNGATFSSRDENFLASPDRDFHPTDVLEDADGSLIVVDTGGWYKLCCPTSQLPKPDVLGAIYRVRKTNPAKIDDPRGLKIAWDRLPPRVLAGMLDDPRPAVRHRVIFTLGKLGAKAVETVETGFRSGRSPEARRNAVWAATRIDHPDARATVREALDDPDESVRQAACQSVSVWRDREARGRLAGLLAGPNTLSAQTRRAAAEALGRVGESSSVNALLDAAAGPIDTTLAHSLTYALIEINDPTTTARRLSGQPAGPGLRRAALVALDQLGSDLLTPDTVVRELSATDRATRSTASWIVGRHPEWAGALVGFYRERLKAGSLPEADRQELVGQLARSARSAPVQELLAEALHDSSAQREVALRAIGQSGLKAVPQSWVDGLTAMLKGDALELRPAAVAAAATMTLSRDRVGDLSSALLAIGGDPRSPAPLRVDALAAVPGGLSAVSPEVFDFLRERLDPDLPVLARTAASNVLSRAKLSAEQLSRLTESVKAAGPLEVDRLLAAFEQSNDEAVGLKLVAAIKASSALTSLRVDMLKPRLDRFGGAVAAKAVEIYTSLNVDAAKQKARLEEILPTLSGGDVRRGQAVFNGTKAACLSCHAVGYLGGDVGPDLTRIGQIRVERDLLESILYPSLSFVRSYEPVTVATSDGKVINGILKKDSADELVLAVNATELAHVPRADVEEMRPGTVSVMPGGLDQQLSRQELADLIAFLKSRK